MPLSMIVLAVLTGALFAVLAGFVLSSSDTFRSLPLTGVSWTMIAAGAISVAAGLRLGVVSRRGRVAHAA